jgi:adenosylcobinamide-phosphate synthase
VAEAAFAAALGLRLGGANVYGGRVELRPSLGTGRPPEVADVANAVRLSSDAAWALTGALAALGLLGGKSGRKRPLFLTQCAGRGAG